MLSIAKCPNPLLFCPSSGPKIKTTLSINSATSENGHGAVDIQKRNQYFSKLVKSAAKGVTFNSKYLETSCFGGTCSAQSLNFAKLFFTSPTYLKSLAEKVHWVANQCQKSSIDLRTQQAALNAITFDPNTRVKDPNRAKVESIVALQDFVVVHASDSIREENGQVNFNDFKKTVESLPEGFYFTRILHKRNNHKGESYGHSVVFINSLDGCYFWDPMGQCYQFADETAIKDLYDRIGGTRSRWALEDPRFYKIMPKELFAKVKQEAEESEPPSLLNRIRDTVFGWAS